MQSKEFVRQDTNQAALLNIDNASLAAYKKNREVVRKAKAKEEENEARLDRLEKSIDQIMGLLMDALERKQA